MPERISQDDVGTLTGSTRVLISFGGATGGFEFAMQLRSDIMQKYGMTMRRGDPSFVYIDAESLKRAKDSSYPFNTDFGMYVMRNPRWAQFYEAAMNNCHTMIFLLSKQWLESQWCWQELDWFQKLCKDGRDIKPIFVVFPDAKSILGQNSVILRNNTSRSPKEVWQSIQEIPGVSIVPINTPAIPDVETVLWEGTPYTFHFRYACNQGELTQILNAIMVKK